MLRPPATVSRESSAIRPLRSRSREGGGRWRPREPGDLPSAAVTRERCRSGCTDGGRANHPVLDVRDTTSRWRARGCPPSISAARYALLLTTSYRRPILPMLARPDFWGGGVGALMASRRFSPLAFLLSIFTVSASAQTLPTPPSPQPSAAGEAPAATKPVQEPSSAGHSPAGPPPAPTTAAHRAARRFRPSRFPPSGSHRRNRRPAPAPANGTARSAAPAPPSPYETGAPNVAGGTPVVPQLASQMTISGAGLNARPMTRPGASARSRAGARRRSSIPTAARPTSITCAATISTTAPTWRRSGTTCRSICQPTRTARATRISTVSFRKRSADWRSARGRISPTSATSPMPATLHISLRDSVDAEYPVGHRR